MHSHYLGKAAALQFSARPPVDFHDIVAEFERKLDRAGGGQNHTIRDGDDIAIFDHGPIRVALGWVRPSQEKPNWYLIVAVGPAPNAAVPIPDGATMSALADRILKRAEARFPTDSVFRCEVDREIDSDFIDLVTELVLSTEVSETPAPVDGPVNYNEDLSKTCASWSSHVLQAHRDDGEAQAKPRSKARPVELHNGRLVGATPFYQVPQMIEEEDDDENDRLGQVRQILTEIDPEKAISLPMHLTLYTFSLSMMLQVPSVGAALLVYNLLREDVLPFT